MALETAIAAALHKKHKERQLDELQSEWFNKLSFPEEKVERLGRNKFIMVDGRMVPLSSVESGKAAVLAASHKRRLQHLAKMDDPTSSGLDIIQPLSSNALLKLSYISSTPNTSTSLQSASDNIKYATNYYQDSFISPNAPSLSVESVSSAADGDKAQRLKNPMCFYESLAPPSLRAHPSFAKTPSVVYGERLRTPGKSPGASAPPIPPPRPSSVAASRSQFPSQSQSQPQLRPDSGASPPPPLLDGVTGLPIPYPRVLSDRADPELLASFERLPLTTLGRSSTRRPRPAVRDGALPPARGQDTRGGAAAKGDDRSRSDGSTNGSSSEKAEGRGGGASFTWLQAGKDVSAHYSKLKVEAYAKQRARDGGGVSAGYSVASSVGRGGGGSLASGSVLTKSMVIPAGLDRYYARFLVEGPRRGDGCFGHDAVSQGLLVLTSLFHKTHAYKRILAVNRVAHAAKPSRALLDLQDSVHLAKRRRDKSTVMLGIAKYGGGDSLDPLDDGVGAPFKDMKAGSKRSSQRGRAEGGGGGAELPNGGEAAEFQWGTRWWRDVAEFMEDPAGKARGPKQGGAASRLAEDMSREPPPRALLPHILCATDILGELLAEEIHENLAEEFNYTIKECFEACVTSVQAHFRGYRVRRDNDRLMKRLAWRKVVRKKLAVRKEDEERRLAEMAKKRGRRVGTVSVKEGAGSSGSSRTPSVSVPTHANPNARGTHVMDNAQVRGRHGNVAAFLANEAAAHQNMSALIKGEIVAQTIKAARRSISKMEFERATKSAGGAQVTIDA